MKYKNFLKEKEDWDLQKNKRGKTLENTKENDFSNIKRNIIKYNFKKS